METTNNTILSNFIQAWTNEKNSPEIFPYETELITEIRNHINTQQQIIDKNLEQIKEEETNNNDSQLMFLTNIMLMEVERLNYLLRSYLRMRLDKIEKYPVFILKNQQVRESLSKEEQQFLAGYFKLFEKHMKNSFLEKLPKPLQKIDDEEEGMVAKPDVNNYVACKINEDLGEVQFLEADTFNLTLKKDDSYIINYDHIKPFIQSNKVSLI
ncbi:sld5 protein [Anaeramoeba flamelloides]|uniref:DNA replication complex GINS protein SLD5 n=1 Tax=Anaeramoeba flamelloides TaxID=1746091 RepID=A0AAV7YE07_9EUKA|nr:sld5 protein [Anaeramoeba flamelloides]KAJ6243282.1 sld5 protein [Anaeramoeba flamelloides]